MLEMAIGLGGFDFAFSGTTSSVFAQENSKKPKNTLEQKIRKLDAA